MSNLIDTRHKWIKSKDSKDPYCKYCGILKSCSNYVPPFHRDKLCEDAGMVSYFLSTTRDKDIDIYLSDFADAGAKLILKMQEMGHTHAAQGLACVLESLNISLDEFGIEQPD